MPLFRALAKNMAASYFGESALRFCNGSYTSVCLYSVIVFSLYGNCRDKIRALKYTVIMIIVVVKISMDIYTSIYYKLYIFYV